MAALGFAAEYEKKSFYEILNPKSASCIDFNFEQGFCFPPVANVSIISMIVCSFGGEI